MKSPPRAAYRAKWEFIKVLSDRECSYVRVLALPPAGPELASPSSLGSLVPPGNPCSVNVQSSAMDIHTIPIPQYCNICDEFVVFSGFPFHNFCKVFLFFSIVVPIPDHDVTAILYKNLCIPVYVQRWIWSVASTFNAFWTMPP